ncbi:MAG: ABC transporter ATP-binding protein [Bacillota bacterium]
MIELAKVRKDYRLHKVTVQALRGVDLTINAGEFVAIMGPSGSGKSTLMNIIGCLDRPTAGKYLLGGEDAGRKNDNQLAEIRNRRIGFVFQTYNLLPRMNALQNVELPLIYRGVPARERREQARAALAAVGLSDRANHKPTEMSGGQQQRCAIARALAAKPSVLLADEPTGNLDSRSGAEIMAIFQDLHESGITVVLVSHDEVIAAHSQRIIRLLDGVVVQDVPVTQRVWAKERLAELKQEADVAS